MKRVFLASLITVVLGITLSIALAKIMVSSTGSAQSPVDHKDAIRYGPSTEKESVESASRFAGKPANPTKAAEQVLTDISNADVEQSTENLNAAFNRLNEMCNKALEIRDYMLTAQYDNKTDPTVGVPTGVGNGNENE